MDKLGFNVVIIGNGSVSELNHYVDDNYTPLPIYTDPTRTAYQHLELNRGFGGLASLRMVSNAVRAISRGHKQGRTAGDPLQQGGIVAVDRSGQTLLSHRDTTAGDHMNPATLIRKLSEL